ncbi:MAG: penicillin acylase family protein, partial [Acidobacteria bacterium]
RWGIAHIYAESEHDLFFAQGYNAARDRLFQLELWRRSATGTMAEALGPSELKRDVGARLHLFRGDQGEELRWYHPRGEAIVRAFVDGVNAYVAETERDPAKLPLEFRMLGLKPGRWTSAVVVSRHNGLLSNIQQEVGFARAVRAVGADKVKSLVYFEPGDPDLSVDPAVDLSLVTDRILELYRAFREPLKFTRDEIVPRYRRSARGDRSGAAVAGDDAPRACDIGSNNWIVSGRLTRSGKPMMMNDPHRTQAAPSLRYWVHLVAPGWNVIGAGEPMLPGVSIGHNEHGAWGLTIFGSDGEDLYVYDTNPANANQYRYRGAWEDMRVVAETIPVKGRAPAPVTLKYTRHGPVLFEDGAHHEAYALRAAWMEIGSAPYLASLRMDQAASWEEFREACTYGRIPSENMVWAGVDGTIGYQAAGIAPRRPNWSGLLPVPGDGRYEWNGYLPIKDLPRAVNPESGFLVTANHYLFPEGYPHRDAMHYTWADPYRALRIGEVLAAGHGYGVEDMVRLQNDDVTIPARALVPLLKRIELKEPRARQARDLLLGWDAAAGKDSVPAGIFEMWLRRLRADLVALRVPAPARPLLEQVLVGRAGIELSMKRIVGWLEAPDGAFGPDPAAGRDEFLARSFTEAVAELAGKLGPDMARWQWGQDRYHHALIHHPLAGVVNEATRARLDVGPAPRGGDAFSPSATGGGDNQTSGGSFKIIADTGDWDASLGLNNPGQGGDPDRAHYRDLFPLWARGEYFPVLYSRAKIEAAAEERIVMQAAKSSPRVSARDATSARAAHRD